MFAIYCKLEETFIARLCGRLVRGDRPHTIETAMALAYRSQTEVACYPVRNRPIRLLGELT